jgi:hypothetical protein
MTLIDLLHRPRNKNQEPEPSPRGAMGAVGGTQYAGRKSRPQGQCVQAMYSYRTGICERLPVERSERDHVLRIDRYALATVYFKQPGELHD